MAPVSMNFGPQKLRRGSRTFAQDQVRRGWSKIITIFQWVLIFEQSVNHQRGPRWWPQIGAAATWLRMMMVNSVFNGWRFEDVWLDE